MTLQGAGSGSMGILERIVAAKRLEVERDKKVVPMRRMIEQATGAPPPRDFAAALRDEGRINIIAEVKRASPSRGGIREHADPVEVARAYAGAGAAAISVLTESRFFLGAPGHLTAASESVQVPVLRKDFLFDEYQVYQSRAMGADSVLLITRLLSTRDLGTLIGVSRSLHMEPLVEVHSEEEIDRAVDCGAGVIGVNNRDLGTMAVSIENSLRLAPRIPEGLVRVSESGIEGRSDIARLRRAGFQAFLIGERLMRETDPRAVLLTLLTAEGA
ncbi:MAG TPA: indole-3-glycerol phosphate synthase TrpC [Candidatus Polarisedimenticolia bacterium]|nr:indole-3-glycerol phosphate synthase TrpC [Candidatus Polarisedimenticolia bacterium]